MLVIRRRAGEGLVVTYPGGETLEVDLLEIEGSQIKLGFKAPREVRVLRREIAETERANREASQPPAASALGRLSETLSFKLGAEQKLGAAQKLEAENDPGQMPPQKLGQLPGRTPADATARSSSDSPPLRR